MLFFNMGVEYQTVGLKFDSPNKTVFIAENTLALACEFSQFDGRCVGIAPAMNGFTSS